jgi:SPX domain protein involved in polyphosphate accumulation
MMIDNHPNIAIIFTMGTMCTKKEKSMTVDNKFFFVRKEKKYLIDEHIWKDLRVEIASRLYQEKYESTEYVSFIESTYFDNASWKTYVDHKNRRKRRFKLRIRQYSKKATKCFIELKEKKRSISYKSRFKIKPQWIPDFLNTYIIPDKLLRHNKKLNQVQLAYTYKKVKAALNNNGLVPVIKIQYQRESFKNISNGLRITFDRNLYFSPIQNNHTTPTRITYTYPQNIIIMETKYSGSRPQWLREFIKKYQLRKTRFSKYCTAVENLYTLEDQSKEQHAGVRENAYAGIS